MKDEKFSKIPLLISYVVLLSIDIIFVAWLSISEFNLAAELEIRGGGISPGYINSIFGALFMGIAIVGAWQWFISLELSIALSRLKSGAEAELSPSLLKRNTNFTHVRLIMANVVAGLVVLSGLVLFFILLMPMSAPAARTF